MGRNTNNEIMLSKKEETYFDLIFNKNMDVSSALTYLRESNIAATRKDLVEFKQKTLDSLIEQQRDEHMGELILTSFERTKLEFDDLIKETKSVLEKSKDNDNPDLSLAAIRELRGQIETALNQQNKTAEQLILAMKEKKEHENKLNQIHEVLKQEKERWLEQYGASVTEDKKIVFEKPTPEFVDFVTRWKFQKEMKLGTVTLNV
jgi:Rad3-related DNA helicase